MKLCRYGEPGQERPGLVDNDSQLRDLSGCVSEIDAATLSIKGLAKLAALNPALLPAVTGAPRFGIPFVG